MTPIYSSPKKLAHNNQPSNKKPIKKGKDWPDVAIIVIGIVFVIGGHNALLSSLFVTCRAISCRCASSCCSVVGFDLNVVGGFDA
jgi:hypothetical protein